MSTLHKYLSEAEGFTEAHKRPWVTLSYAQSLDGSLTAQIGQGTPISGPETKRLTHQLRASHQAILVGVGTLLADDPHLGVRHAEGNDPQPVILDSHLRTPLSSRLIQRETNLPWLFCNPQADELRRARLEEAGARVIPISANAQGRLDLKELLSRLYEFRVRTLMVEGGAQVLQSFLSARLFELLVITVAPRWMGGLPAVDAGLLTSPPLQDILWEQHGEDAVLWAKSQNPQE